MAQLSDRAALIDAYVNTVVDNMDLKDLIRIVSDQLEDNLSSYTDEELVTEIEMYYPELLEDNI